jgi:hypothetical protein
VIDEAQVFRDRKGLQKGLPPREHHVAGIGRRSALGRMDRRAAQAHRRAQLHDPVYAAEGVQHLERGEHPPRGGTHEGRTDAAGRCAGLRGTRSQKDESVFVRTAPSAELAPPLEKRFKANSKAWKFFQSQPDGYRRIAVFYVMSAKQEQTRVRRLDILIRDSAAGLRLGLLRRTAVALTPWRAA